MGKYCSAWVGSVLKDERLEEVPLDAVCMQRQEFEGSLLCNAHWPDGLTLIVKYLKNAR